MTSFEGILPENSKMRSDGMGSGSALQLDYLRLQSCHGLLEHAAVRRRGCPAEVVGRPREGKLKRTNARSILLFGGCQRPAGRTLRPRGFFLLEFDRLRLKAPRH